MSDLQVYHNSWEEYFRSPFGAQICGQELVLRIMIKGHIPANECFLRLWINDKEILYPMHIVPPSELYAIENPFVPDVVFETRFVMPDEPCLVWYYFKIIAKEKTYIYHNNLNSLGGVGTLSRKEGPSFQITVYKPTPLPQWFKSGVMYQIYVDRFYNGNPNKEIYNAKEKSLIHSHWDDTPFYIKDNEGNIRRWNFFGGNLQGVIKKLPFLQELGITTIYFNPIFEAASNHKYDTGDYLKIDPMYGDIEVFEKLIVESKKLGISIILDGVFSHTGSDSRYFNKYNNYPDAGAYQSEESPYYSWYNLDEPCGEYDSWWGVEDLPNVNKFEPSYQDFIFNSKDSVINYWHSKGIKGWRLDVADELPDEFIKNLRKAVNKIDPETVLIGEVWEDASNKISYGVRREYFGGYELDSTMNYPLRDILLSYFLGTNTAHKAYSRIMNLYENYPPENFRGAMNIIGSHDRIRILTLLGEGPAEESLDIYEKENYTLDKLSREKAVKRLKLLSLLQMTLPGVPCVYYGDEAGLEGYSDPYNRRTYPWGNEDTTLLGWYKKIISLRKEYGLFQNGNFQPFYSGRDILGFKIIGESEEIIVCVNRNSYKDSKVSIDFYDELKELQISGKNNLLVVELLSGEKVIPGMPFTAIDIRLKPLEGKVFYVKQKEPSNAFNFSDRSCGTLLHITSLPSSWGIGDMGLGAKDFVDFLSSTGQKYWQILPLNPLGLGYSPYQSPSVMAGNTLLISPDMLMEEGLLTKEELEKEIKNIESKKAEKNKINYPLAHEVKDRLLHMAWVRFRCNENYQNFLTLNKSWLEDYCLYMALKKYYNNKPWFEWDKDIAFREQGIISALADKFKDEIEYQRFLQYTFFCQWQNIKNYANKKGIQIIGDLPFYAAADSCDTWVNRHLFKLNSEGKPHAVSGVPPDYFSETGQNWGNPVYNWLEMEKDGYSWWKAILGQLMNNYDFIRLDHFRGFQAFWEIPGVESTGVNGRWLKGPGKNLFNILKDEFGELPFIAEDLGFLTPEVHNLRNILELPGMKVYQFEAGPDIGNNDAIDLLSNIPEDTILYSGTHDNDTLFGWYDQNKGKKKLSKEEIKDQINQTLINIYKSNATWVIIPMQDILKLNTKSRMNTPGTIFNNWNWRMTKDDMTEDIRKYLGDMIRESRRNKD